MIPSKEIVEGKKNIYKFIKSWNKFSLIFDKTHACYNNNNEIIEIIEILLITIVFVK